MNLLLGRMLFLTLITLWINPVAAQDCGFYIPLQENKGMQFQSFNNRERLQSTQEVRVLAVDRAQDKITATMSTRVFDQRDREIHQSEFTVKCTGNELNIDIESMLDPNMLAGFKDMEMQIEASDIVLPGNLTVGQALPDAEMFIKVMTGNVTFSEVKLRIINRKVEATERITVPAGTFECFKISYNTEMETRTMGIPIRANTKTVEYHASGQGAVRSEIYDSRDRLQGYTVLSKVY